MDFELSEDQVDLAEGVRRLCVGKFPLERIRKAEGMPQAFSSTDWVELGDAGVFGLRLSDADGGLGMGLADAAVVVEELGKALVPGPIISSHLAAGLVDGASDGKAVVGSLRLPPPADDRGRGNGRDRQYPLLVEHFGSLDSLVVIADDRVSVVEPSSIDAVAVDRSLDPLTPMWRVENIPAGETLGGGELAANWRRDEAILVGAYCAGLASATVDLAVEYAKGRRQFGRAIGSFQAIKHLCADMLVRAEVARAAVHAAAVTVDQPDVGDAERAAAGAAMLAVEAALLNSKACVQVYGGMGFTWEVPAHLYLMRARVLGTVVRPSELSLIVADRF